MWFPKPLSPYLQKVRGQGMAIKPDSETLAWNREGKLLIAAAHDVKLAECNCRYGQGAEVSMPEKGIWMFCKWRRENKLNQGIKGAKPAVWGASHDWWTLGFNCPLFWNMGEKSILWKGMFRYTITKDMKLNRWKYTKINGVKKERGENDPCWGQCNNERENKLAPSGHG